MTSAIHQSIHLFHEYCTVKEIRQLRLVSNDLYDVIATCEEVGSRLIYKFTEENKITALRKPFCKINLYLNGVITMDGSRTKSICTSIGKLYIFGYNESSFKLKDTTIQNLELKGKHGCWPELESIVLHPGLKHLKLGRMKIKKVSVLQQIMSYDLVSLTLDDIKFDDSFPYYPFDESDPMDIDFRFDDDDPVTLDFTTMTNLEELEIICACHGIQSVSLPSSIKKIYLHDLSNTPIDFQKCTELKDLRIENSRCFNNHDLDLSTTSITDLILYGLPLRSLILPTSLQNMTFERSCRMSTPIDFQRCPNLKKLELKDSSYFDNHDLDLSTFSLTRLYLYELSLSSLILPHSLLESYMTNPSSIYDLCTIPKVMIKNIPEPGCTKDSFTILPGIDSSNRRVMQYSRYPWDSD